MVQYEFLKGFFSRNSSERNSPVFLSSAKWFKKEFQAPRKGSEQNYEVLSVFLVCKMVRNCISSALVFLGMVRNEFTLSSDVFLFYKMVPRNALERNFERVFRYAKQMEFRKKRIKIYAFFSENGTPTP